MNKNFKMSMAGRVIAILAAFISIFMIKGVWLDIYQVPMIFGNSIPHKYSLFEISDFLETFNMYFNSADLDFYIVLFSIGATVTIILSVLTIIFALLNKNITKLFSSLAAVIGIIIAVIFLIAIQQINAEMKEATYGGIEELLRTTSKPYWSIAFLILTCIGCRIKEKENTVVFAKQNCAQCGAEIEIDSVFCSSCGTKVDIQTQDSVQNRFCSNCGTKVPEDATFCTECGSKLL